MDTLSERSPLMSFRRLEYFLSVAKHLNFTKAARECYVAQAAISQQIKQFEEELGFKLFIGFISGIISQDHDLEVMFLDSFLKLACLEGLDISETISRLEDISEKYHVTFVLSVSMDADELPEDVKKDVIISL